MNYTARVHVISDDRSSLVSANRPKPDVARLTANTSSSAVPVAVPCNDALFVLLLLFMSFSNRVPVIMDSLQTLQDAI